VVLILGGPVLLSLTGAAVTLFMAGRQRERGIALLVTAGGSAVTVVTAAAAGAVIHVATAALLGGIAVLATGLAGARALHLPPPSDSARSPQSSASASSCCCRPS
jgi:putative ABC transport system permease protein